jgi:4-amino-4-deoxy-L-arabinose transferase-like glycosyltransferase
MNTRIFLIIILVIAALIRLISLGEFPNGFTGDEAQQGYSAYSILKTSKDEWGEVLPLFPRGFGDFKPPLYTYLTIPSVAIFGLTIEAVRLPAAIVGILSVLTLFFLAKELTKNKQIALWAAFLMAISPMAIQTSRTAFEGGLGVLTFSLFLLFFLKGTPKNYAFASLFAGLSLYTYHSWRMFIVLFVIGLLIIYRKKIWTVKNWLAAFILILFLLPLIFNINSILVRSADVGISSKNQIISYFQNKRGSPLPYQVDRVFENKILFISDEFVKNYLSYFSPSFFFTGARSDGSYLNFPGFGLLYLVELIFWIFAAFKISSIGFENKKIILLWFFLAPLPAALATGGMNANRTPNFLPLTAIISALGVVTLLDRLRFKKFEFVIIGVLFISLIQFFYFYFIKLPYNPPNNLRFGYDDIFKKVLEVESQYDQVVISKAFTEPQIFVAFYSQMDPKEFQKSSPDWLRYEVAGRQYIDQLQSWNLGKKYLFEDIDWKTKDSQRVNSLIVSKKEDFPEDIPSILDIKNPKGQILYRLVPTTVTKNAN